MKLFLDTLFFIILGYYSYKFIIVLLKMKREALMPITSEESAVIRKIPERPVDLPTYSKQKVGIIIYSFMLLFVYILFIVGAVVLKEFNWSFYLLLFLPFSHSQNVFNMFAVVDDGLLSGSRLIVWKKIKSFQFIPIGINHKYYGYSKEVNEGYELKIEGKIFSESCIVTSPEMKEKLTRILSEHAKVIEEKTL